MQGKEAPRVKEAGPPAYVPGQMLWAVTCRIEEDRPAVYLVPFYFASWCPDHDKPTALVKVRPNGPTTEHITARELHPTLKEATRYLAVRRAELAAELRKKAERVNELCETLIADMYFSVDRALVSAGALEEWQAGLFQ